MSRALRAATASVLAALLIGSAALAAEPVPGGIYEDAGHGIGIGVVGTHEIRAFDMICHGRTWVARAIIGVHLATGDFSYSGTARLARNGRVTSTSRPMTVSGSFATTHLATGHASVAGCSTGFTAILTT